MSFDLIEDDFYELRDFILNDLKILLKSPKGGNYAAALLVTTACDVLGKLKYKSGGGEQFFKEYFVPNDWQSMASSLYDALRNGLAHSFAPKAIVLIDNLEIELCISWKDKPHFKYDPVKNSIYFNIQNLAKALMTAFEKYEKDLINNKELCLFYNKKRNKKRVININHKEKEVWKNFIKINRTSL